MRDGSSRSPHRWAMPFRNSLRRRPGSRPARTTLFSPPALPPASGEPGLTPGHLLALAASLQGLTERRGVTGLSCVVPEPGSGPLEVHAMGRSAGESVNPMQEFLDLPEVSQALL